MSFKKNAVSYAIWILFIMCNCIVFAFLSMICAKLLPVPMPVGALGLSVAFFGLLLLLYLLTGTISRRFCRECTEIEREKKHRNGLILEGILVVLIFALGIGIRIYLHPTAGEDAAYYDVAKVTQDGSGLLVPVQNSVYYYIYLLRGIFVILGNHWIAGIWLQIVLQITGCVLLYFVVRKMAGVIAAVCGLIYMLFSPVWISEGLKYSPQMLYFLLWSLAFLLVMLYLNSSTKGGEIERSGYRFRMWLFAVFLGIVVGFVSYMDVSGIVLMVPVLFLPSVCGKSKGVFVWVSRTIVILFAGIFSLFGFLYLDSLLSGASFLGVLNAWLLTYQPELPNIIAVLQKSSVEVLVLLVLMAFNVFAFCRRKSSEIVSPWIAMSMLMAVFYIFGFTTESMNGRSVLFCLMSIVGGIAIRELFYVNPTEKSEEIESTEEPEDVPAVAAQVCKPRYIENPLPLPKKHVKKSMDFGFTPEESMMKYDVEVADTDDFDI